MFLPEVARRVRLGDAPVAAAAPASVYSPAQEDVGRRRPRWRSAAMIMPSMSWCGSPSSSRRSLNVPGSISSALTTRYFGRGASSPIGTKLHFSAGGEARPAAARAGSSSLTSSLHLCGRHAVERLAQARVAARAARTRRRSSGSPSGRMLLVSGRSIGCAHYGSSARMLVDLLRRQVAVQVVVDHHRRRAVAGAQAGDRAAA